jgi:hypothetical protein
MNLSEPERRSAIEEPGSVAGEMGAGTAQGSPGPDAGDLEGQTGVEVGMTVAGPDGRRMGEVKELQVSYFLVGRSLLPDARIPYSAIRRVHDGTIALSVDAREAGDLVDHDKV